MSIPPEETLAEHEPIIYDHTDVKRCTVHRLTACEGRGGANDYVVFWALQRGEPVPGIEVRVELVTGDGVLIQKAPWEGRTNARGYIHWLHPRQPYRFTVCLNGQIAIGNLSMACPWHEYCNPSNPDAPGYAPHGWRVINRPGHYGYYITWNLR